MSQDVIFVKIGFSPPEGGKREEYSENEALRRMPVACSELCGAVWIYKNHKNTQTPAGKGGLQSTSGLVGVRFFFFVDCGERVICEWASTDAIRYEIAPAREPSGETNKLLGA